MSHFQNKHQELGRRPSSFKTFSKLEEEVESPAGGALRQWAESWAEEAELGRTFTVTVSVVGDLRTGSSSFEGNSTSCYEIGYTNRKKERNPKCLPSLA